MSSFRNLVREIHRRSLWQVLSIYAVSAWVVYQVVLGLYEGVGLPDWVPATAVVLLLVGLPVVLATAFIQEGGPELRGGDRAAPAGGAGAHTASASTQQEAPGRLASANDGGFGADRRAIPAEPIPTARHHRLFTWPRAITAGVLAFAVLGLAATGFMGMRALGIGPAATLMSSGLLEAGEPIVLADFDNGTGEEQLGQMVTDVLRVDLLGSPVIEVADPREIQQALARMRRGDADRLDPDLALEVAVRNGYRAVIVGEVGRVGGGYLLTAEVVSPEVGTLVAFRETAADPDHLLAAIDRLSGAIRGKIGESLRSVRAGEPLAQVTTASLDALRRYSQADRLVERDGEFLRAIGLLEEAIELDPGFAMAHRKIAVYWSNLGLNLQRQVEGLTRAYEHRDRLNERERGHAVAMYHGRVAGNTAAAIEAYRNLLARYPADAVASNNVALLHNERGEYAEAEAALAEARAAGAMHATHHVNLIQALWGLGRTDEIEEVLDAFAERYPNNPSLPVTVAWLAGSGGDLDRADSTFRATAARFAGNPVVAGRAQLGLARVAAQRGQLREATQALGVVANLAPRLGVPSAAALVLGEAALINARTFGAEALDASLETLHATLDLDSVPPLDRPYHALAEAQLWAGRPSAAVELLDSFEQSVPPELRGAMDVHHRLLRAWVAVERGDSEALAGMRSLLEQHPCRPCALDAVAYAHEGAGDIDRAIEYYESFLGGRLLSRRLELDARARPFVLERLADLHERRGEGLRAARYHAELVDLWQNADPELQPRVEAARRDLRRLTAENSG